MRHAQEPHGRARAQCPGTARISASPPATDATPVIRQAGEGDKRWFAGGGTHTWKVTLEETDGAFYVLEDDMVEGKMTPLHCHPGADEMTYVLEGEILMRLGDRDGSQPAA